MIGALPQGLISCAEKSVTIPSGDCQMARKNIGESRESRGESNMEVIDENTGDYPVTGAAVNTAEAPAPAAPCNSTRYCRWAKGCDECRPDTWRTVLPLELRYAHTGSLDGASFEKSRRQVRVLAAELRKAADELEGAHRAGYRLFEIDDHGIIRLVKGRAPRVS